MEKKILIVDDDKDWIQMLAIRLGHEGYQLEVAFDAAQAMAQVVKLKPDIVLLDIMLPAGGGLEALKNIRANFKTFSTPAIVITGKEDKAIKETAEKLGISGYFMKPVDTHELLERIKEILIEK